MGKPIVIKRKIVGLINRIFKLMRLIEGRI